MASDKDIAFIDELKQKYEIKVKKQPCIRVTTTDQGEHMGISASAYEKWTKESLDLKDNEIYVVYQKEIIWELILVQRNQEFIWGKQRMIYGSI